MMASDIICPTSFMNEAEAVVELKEYEHLSYFLKNPLTIKVLQKKGIKHFFPIQYTTFPILYSGQDLIGRDRTGSGKTMAYSLPIIQRFRAQRTFPVSTSWVKMLIVLPTRQLCIQVANEIQSLKLDQYQFQVASIYGGVSINEQVNRLRQGVDVVSATPGRLLDLLERGKIDLTGIQVVCLDQADQMLKMGFQQDVEKIYHYVNKVCAKKPQNLLFSATVPLWVERIAAKFMRNTRKLVDLIKDQEIKTSKTVTHCSMCIKYKDIVPLMKDIVNVYCGKHGRCIIFCQRKDEVKEIMHRAELNIESQALHSDVPQRERQDTFKKFKEGKLKCLISTNVAARGLDIPHVDLIIQLEPPKSVDDYIHRSGRTGRAGKKGVCMTIYLKSEEYLLRNIEKVAKIRFKDIGPPQPDDILNRVTMDLIQHLKDIDQGPLDYFEWLAGQFIYEEGAIKALSRALAYITGIKSRIATTSVMDKQPGMVTYKFKYIGQNAKQYQIKQAQLQKFLCQKLNLQPNSRQIQACLKSSKSVSPQCLAFNFPQSYLIPLQSLQKAAHPSYQLVRVCVIAQLTNQQLVDDQSPQYTQQEYQNAMYYNYEVYIGRLGPEADGAELQKAFARKGVRFVNISVKSKEGKKGFAFMKCLTQADMYKAVELDGQLSFEGKKLEIRLAAEKQNKRDDKPKRKEHRNYDEKKESAF